MQNPAGNPCRHHPVHFTTPSTTIFRSVDALHLSFPLHTVAARRLAASLPAPHPWLSPLESCIPPSCCFDFTMSGKGKSRWADSEEDAAREAKARKEKEEKKRLKREKAEVARRAEEENKRQAAAAVAARGDDDNQDGRPAKRRRLTPERSSGQQAKGEGSSGSSGSSAAPRLLRFQAGGGFGRSNSVEKYDKLNDIEEGAYGWVARAKEIATGEVVALKRLKIEPNDRNGLPVTGLREIQILKDCEHRNIVKLREVVVGDDTSKIEKCVIHGNPFAPVPSGKTPMLTSRVSRFPYV